MKREVVQGSRWKVILIVLGIIIGFFFLFVPLLFALFGGQRIAVGNVALIPISGVITTDGSSYLGQGTVSSQDIVQYIEEANDNNQIKVILLEINSPGGSAVASDEIASAVKLTEKPVISLIREVGASGGYWIASATNHIIANRMSITGSIGVISSYLEFSGLMEKYGVSYERLVAGENKDLGTSFKKLTDEEKLILQKKLNTIQNFFIEEIAQNRGLEINQVKKLATGEFYLGVEALEYGLIDQLGDKDTVKEYLKEKTQLDEVDFVTYQTEVSFFDLVSGIFSQMSFDLGRGLGAIFLEQNTKLMFT